MGARFTVNNPIVVIDEALEREGYFSHFSAFTLACAFFEYFSYVNLRKKGVDMATLSESNERGPSLSKLIRTLKKEGIINSETFKKMDEVREIRNKMVHPKGDISRLYKPTEDERLQIETAKECILLLLNYKPKKKD